MEQFQQLVGGQKKGEAFTSPFVMITQLPFAGQLAITPC
jgi:hypothetical protein